MPIQVYSPNFNKQNEINQAAEQGNAQLAALLGQRMKGQQQLDSQAQQADLTEQAQQRQMGSVQDLIQSGKLGKGVGVKVGDVSVTREAPPANPMAEVRMEQLRQNKMEGLSKRYERFAPLLNDLNEIETLTNTSGKGGALTNVKADMPGFGKLQSALPDSAIGIGTLLGIVPKEAANLRKAIKRTIIDYGQTKFGMRQTADMIKRENEAMGQLANSDPALISRGMRALARQTRENLRAAQSGYTQEVMDAVHKTYDNPYERLSSIAEETDLPGEQSMSGSPQQGAPMSFEQWKASRGK